MDEPENKKHWILWSVLILLIVIAIAGFMMARYEKQRMDHPIQHSSIDVPAVPDVDTLPEQKMPVEETVMKRSSKSVGPNQVVPHQRVKYDAINSYSNRTLPDAHTTN